MALSLVIYADSDIVQTLQFSSEADSRYTVPHIENSFDACFRSLALGQADAAILQLQISSDIAGCLDFMHSLDALSVSPPILLFEKQDDGSIVYTTTEESLNPAASVLSHLFCDAVSSAYNVAFSLFRPAVETDSSLKNSILGKEEALSEILRGCSENEIEIYKDAYSLDLRDGGYYLFFWELQHTEYLKHYYNKDVYNMMGNILERKYISIINKYEGGEAFRLSLDKRCIIINDLTSKSEAFKYNKREEMIRALTLCGNCKTASSYISDRVPSLMELRFARHQYDKDKSNMFFLRYNGIIRAKELRQLRGTQKVDLESVLPIIRKICNYICYDISNPDLAEELRYLYLDIVKPKMSYALYYYCAATICTELMKVDQSVEMNVLVEALTPELLRFSSIEEQYDIMLSHIQKLLEKDSVRYKAQRGIVGQAKEYIEANYSNTITVPQIAEALHVSQVYLSQLFKKATGLSVINYLVTFRINKAKELLENTELSVSDIAEASGFCDFKHFSKTFKNITGTSPSVYRKVSKNSSS